MAVVDANAALSKLREQCSLDRASPAPMKNLKERAVRGGMSKVLAQGVNLGLRMVALMVLARILTPNDFGLVAMVMAVVGVLNVFKDMGLSTATIQRTNVTDGQVSALFWINVGVGFVLTLVAMVCAPLLATFYKEPRLIWVGIALAASFLISALGIQHSALLERQMRFTVLSALETFALLVSAVVGIVMAWLGASYWALIAMALVAPAVYSACVWVISGWSPGWPRRAEGVGSLIRTGGIVTANGLLVYLAYNLEKVALGRYWGPEVLGLYSRAYQLVNMPTDSLNSAVGGVLLSTLSRVKEEPERLRSYFLKGYSVLIAATVPIAATCALLADELIAVILGPQWKSAAPIFRLLAPTVLIFSIINPLWPLLVATGQLHRSIKMVLVLAPIVMAGYLLGLPWGAKGVAAGFSIALGLWAIPHIAWAVHNTCVSLKDMLAVISRPVIAAIAASGVTASAMTLIPEGAPVLLRLVACVAVLLLVYCGILLLVMNQKTLYLDVLRAMWPRITPQPDK
jgi:O-antigen/teichoic acid export membrane protein